MAVQPGRTRSGRTIFPHRAGACSQQPPPGAGGYYLACAHCFWRKTMQLAPFPCMSGAARLPSALVAARAGATLNTLHAQESCSPLPG